MNKPIIFLYFFFYRYSTTNCMFEAALQEVERVCGCSPSFHNIGFDLEQHPTCQVRRQVYAFISSQYIFTDESTYCTYNIKV